LSSAKTKVPSTVLSTEDLWTHNPLLFVRWNKGLKDLEGDE
jgi:hypothetical protein